MTPTIPNLDSEAFASLADQIFNNRVRPALRIEDEGRYVALDVDSGDYEVDSDDYSAVARLKLRRPNAQIWLERAGFATAYQLRSVY